MWEEMFHFLCKNHWTSKSCLLRLWLYSTSVRRHGMIRRLPCPNSTLPYLAKSSSHCSTTQISGCSSDSMRRSSGTVHRDNRGMRKSGCCHFVPTLLRATLQKWRPISVGLTSDSSIPFFYFNIIDAFISVVTRSMIFDTNFSNFQKIYQ